MRVLNVNHTLDPVTGGGTAERTYQMSRFLARSGVQSTVLTTTAGSAPPRTVPDADVTIVAVPLISERFFVPRVSRTRLEQLISAADIVHLMGHWSVLNILVYTVARKLKKPYVVCPAGALPMFGRSQILKRIYNFVAGKAIVRNANACIAITENEVKDFARYGVSADKIRVIPNGISADDFARADVAGFRSKFGLGESRFILFMGRLTDIKGPDLLLTAFLEIARMHSDLHLVFAGPDGGMCQTLQRTAHNAGVADRVHFTGYLGGDDKSSAYRAAMLLAIPSRQEAMSIVVLEAGVTDTAVLLTNECGFNVASQFGGAVVSATIDGIRQGLTEMLADQESLRLRGKLLGDFVRARFSWTSIVHTYMGLYEQLRATP